MSDPSDLPEEEQPIEVEEEQAADEGSEAAPAKHNRESFPIPPNFYDKHPVKSPTDVLAEKQGENSDKVLYLIQKRGYVLEPAYDQYVNGKPYLVDENKESYVLLRHPTEGDIRIPLSNEFTVGELSVVRTRIMNDRRKQATDKVERIKEVKTLADIYIPAGEMVIDTDAPQDESARRVGVAKQPRLPKATKEKSGGPYGDIASKDLLKGDNNAQGPSDMMLALANAKGTSPLAQLLANRSAWFFQMCSDIGFMVLMKSSEFNRMMGASGRSRDELFAMMLEDTSEFILFVNDCLSELLTAAESTEEWRRKSMKTNLVLIQMEENMVKATELMEKYKFRIGQMNVHLELAQRCMCPDDRSKYSKALIQANMQAAYNLKRSQETAPQIAPPVPADSYVPPEQEGGWLLPEELPADVLKSKGKNPVSLPEEHEDEQDGAGEAQPEADEQGGPVTAP